MKPFDINTYNPSPSFLKKLLTENLQTGGAPAKALYMKLNEKNEKKSDALIEGALIDTAILDRENLERKFFVSDLKINTDTKKYKLAMLTARLIGRGYELEEAVKHAKRFTQASYKVDTILSKWDCEYQPILNHLWKVGERTVVSSDMFKRALKIRESALNSTNSFLPEYIERGILQKKVTWENKETGLSVRGEADIVIPNEKIIDLKSTYNASPKAFAGMWGQAKKLHYAFQLSAYAEAYEDFGEHQLLIIAVEKEPPYLIQEYNIGYSDYEWGRDMWNRMCAKFQYIQENDLWGCGYEFDAMHRLYRNDTEGRYEYHEGSLSATIETEMYNQYDFA